MLPIGPKAHNIDESTHGNGEGRHAHLGQRHPNPSQRVPQKILKKSISLNYTIPTRGRVLILKTILWHLQCKITFKIKTKPILFSLNTILGSVQVLHKLKVGGPNVLTLPMFLGGYGVPGSKMLN